MPATFGIAAISIAGKARSYVPCLLNKTEKWCIINPAGNWALLW